MTDELDPTDPLQRVATALRAAVPIAPGLPERIRVRGIRQRQRRMVAAVAALTVLIFAIGALHNSVRPPAVTFAIKAPSVQSVELVGDFTDWRPDRVRMRRVAADTWQGEVRLRPGRYRFAYVVNHEQWRADSNAATVPDDFGRPTSVMTVVQQ